MTKVFTTLLTIYLSSNALLGREAPVPTDPATEVIKFAGPDLIKHPIGMTYTNDGKLLVIESHTHFRPKTYGGPASDQIVWIRDIDGDGIADTRSIFFGEDIKATMNIATHPKTGAIYVATRNGIVRLWDRNGNGVADAYTAERIVYFDFEKKYLDNGYGCAGLAFDDDGNLLFGIGGILGAAYTLKSTDGVSYSDQGEGGNIWKCNPDGGDLKLFATGFWNPFGLCHAPGGHVFATDNDPSSRPPSRLHHVIDGGDYGYQFRYGASGRHPFISWDGELPGTLPMLHGTGDAPCDVLFHQGNLLVASWSDHRVEIYPLTWDKTHFKTERKILLKGGLEFRPVGFATGSDGDLYISDWVKGDYQLHGEGAIWRIKNWAPADTKVNDSITEQKEIDAKDPWTFSRLVSGHLEGGSISPEDKKVFELLTSRFHKKENSDELIFEAVSPDQENKTLRLLAMKWIADKKLEKFREPIEAEISDPQDPILFHAAITTKARLDGKAAMDDDIQKMLLSELESASPMARKAAFLLLDDRGKVEVDRLRKIYETGTDEMRSGVALTLKNHSEPEKAVAFAREIIKNDESPKIAAFASLADPKGSLRKPVEPLEIGEFIFHQNCAKCHRVNGYGKKGGLDLSAIGVRGREHIINSVVNPSAEISPQYETWKVLMADGTEHVGFVTGEKAGIHFYSDAAGNKFTIDTNHMVEREHLPVSLMPAALNEQIGEEDFTHLVDWLLQLK
ncbi:MAG: c-type cytochrome [Verrucomicrobiales bacterium]|nr:c-type cytochrome [Verrucomicrobiales bacterium]